MIISIFFRRLATNSKRCIKRGKVIDSTLLTANTVSSNEGGRREGQWKIKNGGEDSGERGKILDNYGGKVPLFVKSRKFCIFKRRGSVLVGDRI